MAMPEVYASASASPALVMYWPGTDGGPWDTGASELIESLAERLGVFVTCVGSGPRSLTLGDAFSAARFMGCESVVVVAPEGCRVPTGEGLAHEPRASVPSVCVTAAWTARDVAGAYLEASERLDRAA